MSAENRIEDAFAVLAHLAALDGHPEIEGLVDRLRQEPSAIGSDIRPKIPFVLKGGFTDRHFRRAQQFIDNFEIGELRQQVRELEVSLGAAKDEAQQLKQRNIELQALAQVLDLEIERVASGGSIYKKIIDTSPKILLERYLIPKQGSSRDW